MYQICWETDHITINGPGGSAFAQHFAWEKFVEMNPAEKLNGIGTNATLEQKGPCRLCC